jgi:hypothetical protein
MLTQYELHELPTLGAIVHDSLGEENWYFTIVATGKQAYIKLAGFVHWSFDCPLATN